MRSFGANTETLSLSGLTVTHRSTDIGFTGVFNSSTLVGFDESTASNEAIHIVRTIGQAFEVCHKLSVQTSMNSPTTVNQSPQQANKAFESDPIEKTERYLQSTQQPNVILFFLKKNNRLLFLII
ncbi:unnamed protein product [Adineta steineri]|uniref:Uncharacterized protein n=1 Tax=Adineta steineri TaxID=433720 RepID=A0A820L9A7_9BILA|nr:unnamed protein product [Adineta steineri]